LTPSSPVERVREMGKIGDGDDRWLSLPSPEILSAGEDFVIYNP